MFVIISLMFMLEKLQLVRRSVGFTPFSDSVLCTSPPTAPSNTTNQQILRRTTCQCAQHSLGKSGGELMLIKYSLSQIRKRA